MNSHYEMQFLCFSLTEIFLGWLLVMREEEEVASCGVLLRIFSRIGYTIDRRKLVWEQGRV